MKILFRENKKSDVKLIITDKWEGMKLKPLEYKIFGNVYVINFDDDSTKLEFSLWSIRKIQLAKANSISIEWKLPYNETRCRILFELLYANYSITYTNKKSDVKPNLNVFLNPKVKCKNLIDIAIIYQTIELAKQLSDSDPVTDGTPFALSNTFKKLLTREKIKVDILNKQQIKCEKLNLFLKVNQGSQREPYLVVAKYLGNRQDKHTTLLIGKGITFDTGGINLKKEMNDMRLDKCGGCDVLCVLIALAKLKVKVNVIAVVGFTDNIIGESSVLPSSVIKTRDNISVQIDSTDAEGRLTLADMISYGIEKFHPHEIIEISTLTGSIAISLGKYMTGCWSNDLQFANYFKSLSDVVGDEIWIMPMHRINDMAVRSAELADITNAPNKNKYGSSSSAAAFLNVFVNNQSKFIHLDIGATGIEKNRATGVMIKGLINYFVTKGQKYA